MWSRWWPSRTTFPGRDVEGFYILSDLPSVPRGADLPLMTLPPGCYTEMKAASNKLLNHYPIGDANRISWSQFFSQYLPPANEDPKTYSKKVRVKKPLHQYFQQDVYDSGKEWKIEGSKVTSSLFEVQYPAHWALCMPTVNSQWDPNTPGQPFLQVDNGEGAIQARYTAFVNNARVITYMRGKQLKGLRAILSRRMLSSGKATPHSGNLPVLVTNITGFNTRFMSSRMSPMLDQQQLTVDGILRDGAGGRYAHDSNVWTQEDPVMTLRCFQTLREKTHLSSEFVSRVVVLLRARDKMLVNAYSQVNSTTATEHQRKACLYFSPNYLDAFLASDNSLQTLTESFATAFSSDFFDCHAAFFPALDDTSKEWFLISIYMASTTVVIHFPKYATRPQVHVDRSAPLRLQLQQSLLPVLSHHQQRRAPATTPPAPTAPPPPPARPTVPPPPPAVITWSVTVWEAPVHEKNLAEIETIFDSGLYLIWNIECRYFDIDMYFERQDLPHLRKNIGYCVLQSHLKLLD